MNVKELTEMSSKDEHEGTLHHAVFFDNTPLQLPQEHTAGKASDARSPLGKLPKTENLPTKLRQRLEARALRKESGKRYFAPITAGANGLEGLQRPGLPQQAVAVLQEKSRQRREQRSHG
jgi:hypothetical protein